MAHTFDAVHMCDIHRHLFQDVYEWAGEYRTQNMGRLGDYMGFAGADNGEIDLYLEAMNAQVVDTHWAQLERDQFADEAAKVFVYLNQAHPFREGNGRATKMFMHHVAEQSRFDLHFERVSPDAWNHMSAMTRPQRGRVSLDPDEIAPAFQLAAQERATAPEESVPEVSAVRSASYPRAATQATQPGASRTGAERRHGAPYVPNREHGTGGIHR